MSNMYENAKTWNPFKGCLFNCSYCRPSFQAQAKRQKHNCRLCYDYAPHVHPERLHKIPKAKIVFACGNGDVAFCRPGYLELMLNHAAARPKQDFYFQSKRPSCFEGLTIPDNVILVTTLETNRCVIYRKYVSKTAPDPMERDYQFRQLKHQRKIVTIEPIMEFELEILLRWVVGIKPEAVWIGYNSRPKQVQLPEPTLEKAMLLITRLEEAGIPVHQKTMRERIDHEQRH